MNDNRMPAGASAAGLKVGGRFASVGGTRPAAGSLTRPSAQGTFLYPPVTFTSREEYVDFWQSVDVPDQALDRLVRAREKWRVPMVQAGRERLVAEWEAQPRIRRMAKRNPGFYADERNARATATGPENQYPPLPGELARPIAVAHQLWSKTHLVPGLTKEQIATVTVPVPGDPNTTVGEIVTNWQTDQWAPTALGSTAV